MHFSNMAVSLLAQSLPLAVAYHAGWRKREKSESQSTILRAAIYHEFHNKKGFVLEKKHAEATRIVQDKQGAVLKKHSGTVHPELGTASSKIPSVDLEPAIECAPLSKAPDAGIFACGMDRHCVESEESELGGFCVAFGQAPILSRALQLGGWSGTACGLYKEGATCDCSLFNNTSGEGTFTCAYPEGYCQEEYPTVCGNFERAYNITNSTAYLAYCLEPEGGVPTESLCYSWSFDCSSMMRTECEFKINNVTCNSCLIVDSCPGNSTDEYGYTFDCTNTVVDIEGSTCERGLLGTFFDAPHETPSPSSMETMTAPLETASPSPLETMMLTPPTAPPETPSESPVEMPTPTTSSGSSHKTKVAIVASAAGTAWLASFGA